MTVEEYIAKLEAPRRADVEKLHALIRKAAPELVPSMLSGMIGYGTYHYRYESGREGDAPIVALSSRKAYISVYVSASENGVHVAVKYKKELPKADIGKSCIRFKKLGDVDLKFLQKIVREGAALLPNHAV